MTITIDPYNVYSGLMFMSLVGAILCLAVAIIVYPTMKERHSHPVKKSSR